MPANTPGPVPKDALAYFRAKGLKPGFDYRDVWREEHAAAFTVAKAMQLDILTDIREAVDAAVANGTTFAEFSANLRPLLEKKGWWGRRDVVDPATKQLVSAQLGSPRRLHTIYNANLRTARAAGQWSRIQRSKATHPYLLYRLGPSKEHRLQHTQWAGLLLPVDDPWWLSHFPPNGWGCKCRVRQVSKREHARLVESGKVQTTAPPLNLREWVNKRTGQVEQVPDGIDPGWDTNPGTLRNAALKRQLKEKEAAFDAVANRPLPVPLEPQKKIANLDELLSAGEAAARPLIAAHRRGDGFDEAGFLDALHRELARQRQMDATIKTAGGGQGAKHVKAASRYLPDSWLRRSDDAGKLRVRMDSRGRGWHWSADADRRVRLSQFGVVDAVAGDGFIVVNGQANAMHELMHRIQSVYPELDAVFQRLHRRRTRGESLVRLSVLTGYAGYARDEVARPDRYMTPYQGKEYDGRGALEVMTIAFEYVLGRGGQLEKVLEMDREMLYLVIGALFYL